MISKDSPIAVFGLGLSGFATARWLVDHGYNVIAWDDNAKSRERAAALNIPVDRLTSSNLESCKTLILAPGVPLHFPEPHPVVREARAAGVEIICDIELFHRLNPSIKTIGITGTNGKSTVTALLTQTLNACGVNALMGGNIGKPIFDLEPDEDTIMVLELSSYQLDLCPNFHPDIAVLLNITPDHLDRHGNMENYVEAKASIFAGQGKAVITGDDEHSQNILRNLPAGRELLNPPDDGLVKETRVLKGAHNIQNMRAVMAVCQNLGLQEGDILSAFETFPGLAHRQYLVAEIDGISFINDSKATNVEAAAKALSAYDDIYWIVGGQEKDGGLSGLESYAPKIRAAFVIGEKADGFERWLYDQGMLCVISKTLERAVTNAISQIAFDREAGKIDSATVLLAPACASFDQFKNFEERGECFITLVEQQSKQYSESAS